MDALEICALHGMVSFCEIAHFIVHLTDDGYLSFPAKAVAPVLNVFIHHGLSMIGLRLSATTINHG